MTAYNFYEEGVRYAHMAAAGWETEESVAAARREVAEKYGEDAADKFDTGFEAAFTEWGLAY